METSKKTPQQEPVAAKKFESPANLQEYVSLTKEGVVKNALPISRPQVEKILKLFEDFLKQDHIKNDQSFTAIYKLLRYGLEFNEKRVPKENQTLQECLNSCEKFTVKALQSAIKGRMDQVTPAEAEVMKLVAAFNEGMLSAFNEQFSTKKGRLFATTVNFVSETGFSKILESIYYASPRQSKEIAYMFLKKVFKNTYEVVQRMDKKQITYPCVFLEPLHDEDKEEEQRPPMDSKGTAYLCYDFDIGNLYSFLDILSNVLRKMLDQNYIRERYKFYLQEKKKNEEEGYISYPLLLSLILRYESKEDILNNMIVLGKGEKDEIKAVLLDFIKTLQTSEFLYLYSVKRYLYLKHFVLELLHDKQLAQIPQFFSGMVIAVALLSNEQYKISYELIERLMEEKTSLEEETRLQLANTLNQLTPHTLDHLLRFIVKGAYLVAGPQSKKMLEEKFEDAKVLSVVQDPLSSIMQGLTEIGLQEAQMLSKSKGKSLEDPKEGEAFTQILDSEEIEEKFALWQNIIQQIFQWQIKNIPAPIKWMEKTAKELKTNKERVLLKDDSADTSKRLEGLHWTQVPEGFSFFKDSAAKWQEKVQFVEKFYRRRGVCLGIEQSFKEIIEDLFEALMKYGAVSHTTHVIKDGEFEEKSLIVKLSQDPHYQLPSGQAKGNIQLFLGMGLIPMKKPHGPIETKPCLFLFQEIPSGFQNENLQPFEVKTEETQAEKGKLHELLEIPLTESYYLPILMALMDVFEKWLPLPDWDKESSQKVMGAIQDFQRLVNSKDLYGAVGDEVLSNPKKKEKPSQNLDP